MAQERLYEVRLPEGDAGSITVGWYQNGAQRRYDPSEWLSKGYQGVRFIGAGIDKTHLRCAAWDGITLAITRHPGIVQVEGVTLHAGFSKGVHCGEANYGKQLFSNFQFRLYESKGIVPPPTASGRTKWLLFGYQSDVHLRDVELEATQASEHASYWHGFAKRGLLWERVRVIGSGAEGCKVRSDSSETAWCGKGARVVVKDSEFRNWYQQWSDRGGAAIVCQGSAADVVVERCLFWGGSAIPDVPAHQRSKCVMVSSEGLSYDILTGRVDAGFGNGFVVIRDCGMRGGPAPEWTSPIARVGQNGGSQMAARGVLIERCGIWGENMTIQTDHLPSGKLAIRGCNTPAITMRANGIGIAGEVEAVIPTATRLIPVSEGIQA